MLISREQLVKEMSDRTAMRGAAAAVRFGPSLLAMASGASPTTSLKPDGYMDGNVYVEFFKFGNNFGEKPLR
jgi:hypothetical protein